MSGNTMSYNFYCLAWLIRLFSNGWALDFILVRTVPGTILVQVHLGHSDNSGSIQEQGHSDHVHHSITLHPWNLRHHEYKHWWTVHSEHLTYSSCRPRKPQFQTLIYSTFRQLMHRLYKPLAEISFRSCTSQDQTSTDSALITGIRCSPSLVPLVQTLEFPQWNLIDFTNLLSYSIDSSCDIAQ